ncbi:flagellar hook-length control protein FliK [Massilia forsythiae]|uniref:Flagellar hook-length control protein FliK n=1 Tax=Massilia forsythiae TaxID=2728020 RepID=A0A7Z2VX91_9BURK|nr:flagellar hook-length control protein FliK [Massilia forsythiae]QJE00951.1 flagellar hook-length control protein FliK [Massilia forsythiae]
MLPRDASLAQVARTAPLGPLVPVGDARLQAFQRAFAGMVGQSMQAEVMSTLPDGSHIVRVNDMAARMQLPAGAQAGSQVPLTLVSLNPRPTFQVDTGRAAPAFAEAAPPPEGTPSAAPAYLEGKEAAALMRTSGLLAQAKTVGQLGSGAASDANTSISRAGKLLGDVIAAAQKADAPATAAVGRTPLLPGPMLEPAAIAAALEDGMGKSGLFYESHVAEWAQGARALAELKAEPQAQGRMSSPLEPATAQFINLQLNAHEQARVAWQGQLWPGQELRWEIERDPGERDASGGQGRADGGADGAGGTWQSSLRLRFGELGEVSARVVLSGDQLHIRLDAASADAGARMQAGRARLETALDAAGVPLSTLAIHAAPSAAPAAPDGAADTGAAPDAAPDAATASA